MVPAEYIEDNALVNNEYEVNKCGPQYALFLRADSPVNAKEVTFVRVENLMGNT